MTAQMQPFTADLDRLEDRLKRSNQMLQFFAIKRDLHHLDARIVRGPNFDRARLLFLGGVLFAKAALTPTREDQWPKSSTESLFEAKRQLDAAMRIISLVRDDKSQHPQLHGKEAFLQQLKILEQRCAYEWLVCYTVLNSWGESVDPTPPILSTGILGPETLGRFRNAVRRKRVLESKMHH